MDLDPIPFLEAYEENGYAVLPTPSIIPEHFQDLLLDAVERAVAKARTAEWPHRRTVGSAFPPFARQDDAEADVWGVQHLMHPSLGEDVFVRWYTSPAVRRVMSSFMACDEGELQMELFNLLINPSKSSFALPWHHDDVRSSATVDEERAALAKRQWGVQWNTALLDDDCLYVVPGTHKNVLSEDQKKVMLDSVAETSEGNSAFDPMKMPGAMNVVLPAGETLIYNQNILHCAVYTPDPGPSLKRATLHACMGNAVKGGGGHTRARNILQHGLSWIKGPEMQKSLTAAAEQAEEDEDSERQIIFGMWKNLVQMGKNVAIESLGYSQT